MMVFEDGLPISDTAAVTDFETERGIRLPPAFIKIVEANDGAYIVPSDYPVFDTVLGKPQSYSCDLLLSFGKGRIQMVNSGLTEGLPSKVIAFGIEGGGYLTCFDYRDPAVGDDPPVVIFIPEYDDEHAITRVSDSFAEFLGLLGSAIQD